MASAMLTAGAPLLLIAKALAGGAVQPVLDAGTRSV